MQTKLQVELRGAVGQEEVQPKVQLTGVPLGDLFLVGSPEIELLSKGTDWCVCEGARVRASGIINTRYIMKKK